MTETEIRSKIVSTAKKYLGCNEKDGTHKQIIDVYNAHTPRTSSYTVKYTDSWCATFVSAVGILCGLSDIIFPECSCGRMVELYEKKDRWKEDDSYVPKPGDLIMYDWGDNGKGDCTGWPDHVGIIVEVSASGKTIKIIEGNISDAVNYRTMSVDARYIRGYCLPDYASKATEAEKTDTSQAAASTVPASAGKKEMAKDSARNYLKPLAGTYKVTASALNVRHGAGITKKVMVTIPKGTKVQCYGFYNLFLGVKWLYVQFTYKGTKYTGFASSKYLSK